MKFAVMAGIVAISILVVGAAQKASADLSTRQVFIITCADAGLKQVDPIVNPGPPGTLSDHLHQFAGNPSVQSDSTYASMRAGGTNCNDPGDTAGYWNPALQDQNGNVVRPLKFFAYYRNIPVISGVNTQAFPAGLKMIAGGSANPGEVGWKCFNTSSIQPASSFNGVIPHCSGATNWLVEKMTFPACWDGVNLDSANHRSHMADASGGHCDAAHPVKLPELSENWRWCHDCGGPGWHFTSTGHSLSGFPPELATTPHSDYWNTWDQARLEQRVSDCYQHGNCG